MEICLEIRLKIDINKSDDDKPILHASNDVCSDRSAMLDADCRHR